MLQMPSYKFFFIADSDLPLYETPEKNAAFWPKKF